MVSERKQLNDQGGEDFTIDHYRHLDFLSGGSIPSDTICIGLYTCHKGINLLKPQMTWEITLTPGCFGLSIINDKGLIITLNELGTMHKMRPTQNGIPQFILIKQIAEQCSTVQEVKEYLDKVTAANSHILTVSDNHGNAGVLEILPPTSDDLKEQKYRFRDIKDEQTAVTPVEITDQN